MNITEQMLKGEIPVTEEELRFLAKNHETYDLTKLDVSQIRDFSYLFKKQVGFNQPIGNWNVSNGTDFSLMFSEATLFNQPIGNWDISNCTDFSLMFANATSFNQPIGNWNVSNCTDFSLMFSDAKSFNQPIGHWDVSNGTEFSFMFYQATSFNQPIGNWDLSNGTEFSFMFAHAESFNQNITWTIKKEYLVQILKSNFNISIQYVFEKIGVTCNADQLSLIFKDSPDNPFPEDFDYNAKELYLIKSNKFYGFMDKNNNAYQIDTSKITIDELIDICDINTIKEFT